MTGSFKEAARLWRKQAGLSLRDAAEQIDISFTYLSKMENGHLPAPSTETLEVMAKVYGMSRIQVFYRARKMLPEWETQLFESQTFFAVAELIQKTRPSPDEGG